jgi:YegS/Rv2252/BmrU family lipid kinase
MWAKEQQKEQGSIHQARVDVGAHAASNGRGMLVTKAVRGLAAELRMAARTILRYPHAVFERITYVVNPASQNGNTGREWSELARTLPAAHETLFTEKVGDAISLARAAADRGADLVVSVGGDGTLNEVTSGLMLVAKDKRPALGLVPRGTGGDFRRTLGYPKGVSSVAAVLKRSQTRTIDVGALTYRSSSGADVVRHFVNICSFGLSGVVDEAVNSTSKALGGKLSFMVGTLRGLAKFRPVRVEMSIDGEPFVQKRISIVAACNGRAFGGGMLIAPTADPADGRLDIVTVDPFETLGDVLQMPKLYKGEHLGLGIVSYRSGTRLTAKSDEAVLIDVDGEQLGRLPIDIELVPQALRMVC